MRVYIIRHGESETNLNKKWTGWLNAPLTDKGKEDAKAAAEFLKGMAFDKVYSSDLGRAVETAKIALPGCNPETSPLLREISVGTLEGTFIYDMTDKQLTDAAQKGFAEYGGESRAELKLRIREFMKKLEGEAPDNAAVFCHGGWLCGMRDEVLGVSIPREKMCCNNCTVAVFEYKDDVWMLHSWINLT